MPPAERHLRVRNRGLDWRVLEDETVVLDLEGSRYLAINRTGTLLWPLLAQGATRAQLVETLTNEWEIEPRQATRDIDEFCAQLDAEGLLER